MPSLFLSLALCSPPLPTVLKFSSYTDVLMLNPHLRRHYQHTFPSTLHFPPFSGPSILTPNVSHYKPYLFFLFFLWSSLTNSYPNVSHSKHSLLFPYFIWFSLTTLTKASLIPNSPFPLISSGCLTNSYPNVAHSKHSLFSLISSGYVSQIHTQTWQTFPSVPLFPLVMPHKLITKRGSFQTFTSFPLFHLVLSH